MEENEVVVQGVELDTSVNVELPAEEVQIIETIEEISVEAPEETTIDVSEVSGVIVGTGEFAEHQHVIEDVTNLVDKLKLLGSPPHEVYSQNGGYAEFREWTKNNKSFYVKNIKEHNPTAIGYFVGLVKEDDGNIYLDICHDTNTSVYGVVALNSGFCGYQDEKYNLFQDSNPLWFADKPIDRSDSNSNYAKVCLLGDVMTRVHSEENFNQINIGDYVVPDEYGCAIKSESGIGFKVISKGEAGINTPDYKWYYVTIALVPQNDNVSRVMAELESTRENVGNLSIQIGKLESDVGNISGITSVIEDFEKEFDEYQESVDNKLSAAEEANKTANEVASSAQAAIQGMQAQYTEALGAAQNAQSAVDKAAGDISKIKEGMQILDQHGDAIVGFFTEADANGANISTLVENTENITSIQQDVNNDGGSIKFLVTHADMYSVGSHSVTDGLSYKGALNILKQGGFIYVPTETHIEESYIYECRPISVDKGVKTYCKIGDGIYSFVSKTDLNADDILIYDSKIHKLTINNEEVNITPENVGTYSLEFESEKVFEFEAYKVYKWRKDPDGDDYRWVKQDVNVISYDDKEPTYTEGTELWYCGAGILDEKTYNYEYTPGTLYRWNGTRWIAVATVNDSNARSTALLNQTAEYIESTITDVKGNISTVRQEVDEISSTVSNVNEQLSTVTQKADEIAAGVYNGEGYAAQLAIALNKISSTASSNFNMLVGEFFGMPTLSDDCKKYPLPPVWNGDEFVFSGDPVADGQYCLNPDNSEQYYKLYDDKYEIYTSGTQAITSLQQQVGENKSAIESFTKLDTATNTTLTRLFQESDADSAQIGSVVMGEFRERTYISLDITEDEKNLIGNRYSEAPTWETTDKIFGFGDNEKSDTGLYCMPIGTDGSLYWKLLLDSEGNVIGYEQYEMKSSTQAAIIQKADKDSGEIGLYVGNEKVDGGIFVNVINDQTTALIDADKVKINGITTFSDILVPGTTTISGDYIRTGVLTSNNYVGPATYRMYGLTIDLENNKLIKATSSKEYVYYAPIVNGDVIFVDEIEGSVCFYCTEIKEDIDLYTEKQDASEYRVSLDAFDILPSEINMEGTKFDLNAGTIYSKNLILDPKGNLSITGKITATSGLIGGFTIADTYLYNNQITLQGKRNEDGTRSAGVYLGNNGIGLGNGNFVVDNNGNLATKGEVSIYHVTEYSNGEEDYMKVFNVNPDTGVLTLNGNIVITGSIVWDTTSNPICVLYAPTARSAPTAPWLNSQGECNYGSSSSAGVWHTKYQEEEDINKNLKPDYYASYSYDHGKTWTDAVKIRGEDGAEGKPGLNGTNAYVTADKIFDVLTNEGTEQGLFSAFYGDTDSEAKERLFINAEYIKAGVLSGITVKSEDTAGNNITMNTGIISLTPSGFSNPKMQIGFSTSAYDRTPYIAFGSGTTGTTTTVLGIPMSIGTTVLYKNSAGFHINLYGSDGETQSIHFYDYNKTAGITESNISFGDSIVDFTYADVRGLKVTFG